METKIITQDVYLPVDFVTNLAVVHKDFNNGGQTFKFCIEKHTDMVVLTKDEFEKAIADAYDAGGEFEYGSNITKEEHIASILNDNVVKPNQGTEDERSVAT